MPTRKASCAITESDADCKYRAAPEMSIAKVIMYADKITDSMKRTHRRDRQAPGQADGYTTSEHGIIPTPIVKNTKTNLSEIYVRRRRARAADSKSSRSIRKYLCTASGPRPVTAKASPIQKERNMWRDLWRPGEVEYMTPEEIAARIERVKSDMVAAARRTEFIVAAQLRDELIKLQDIYDGIKGKPAAVAADIRMNGKARLGTGRRDNFSGDAYVDHIQSFSAAVIGRTLQAAGFKGRHCTPSLTGGMTFATSRKLGRPRLFFGVSAGAMDSMVNHYTANRRLRHDDAYTPGKHGMRPDYPTTVYSGILKELFPRCAGHRRRDRGLTETRGALRLLGEPAKAFDHSDAKADMIVYGMGERTVADLARRL